MEESSLPALPKKFLYLYLLLTLMSFTRLVIIPLLPGEKVSAVTFCKQFLAYAVHIDWCYHSIPKHTSGS